VQETWTILVSGANGVAVSYNITTSSVPLQVAVLDGPTQVTVTTAPVPQRLETEYVLYSFEVPSPLPTGSYLTIDVTDLHNESTQE